MSSSPKCLACPHLAKQHNLEDGSDRKCRVKILTGWSTEAQQYLSSKPCGCPGYEGLDPNDCCACEYVPTSPNCVRCGKVKV